MNHLRTYLWKEWREQRAVLGILALGLLLVTAVLSVALPREFLEVALAYDWVVGMCLVAVLFTVGSDLLPRDLRREPLQFLERAPAGLRVAFRGKLIFFLAAMGAAGLFGILLAEGTALFTTGEAPGLFFGWWKALMILVLGAILALWVFAASAWVTTSAMAVPSAVVFLLVAGWPGWLVAREVDGFRPDEYLLFCLLGPLVGALVSARWSFVVGAARSRSRRAMVLGGIGVGMLFFVPSWVWAGIRYVEWMNPPLEIAFGYMGLGERFAFLTVRQRLPRERSFSGREYNSHLSALLLDLRDGNWSFEGERGESAFYPDVRLIHRKPGLQLDAFPYIHDGSGDYYDSSTGLPVGPDVDQEKAWSGLGPGDFGLEEEPRYYSLRWTGLGHRFLAKLEDGREVHLWRDAKTGLVIDKAAIAPDNKTRHGVEVLILPGRWLVREAKRWTWFDPSSGEREPFEELEEGEIIINTLDDGTLLLNSDGQLVRLNPRTGDRRRLRVLGRMDRPLTVHRLSMDEHGKPLPAGSIVVTSLSTNRGGHPPALLDLAAGTLRLPPRRWKLSADHTSCIPLCIDGPRAIAIEDSERIVRYDFAAETREVIFDVAQL